MNADVAAVPPAPSPQQKLEALGYTQELSRSMTLADVVVYGLIYMVPMAPIVVFGFIYNMSDGMVATVYLVAAVAMYFSAVSYSEMAKEFPVAGSVYSYVRFGAGPAAGFFSGWAILLDYLLLPGLLFIFSAAAMHLQVPSLPQWVWIPVLVVLSTAINLKGITFAAWMNMACLWVQFVVLGIFALGGVLALLQGHIHLNWAPLYRAEVFSIPRLFAAIPVAALSYIGFDAISTLNEESQHGGETVSKATMIVLFLVAAIFVLQVYLGALFVPTGTHFNTEGSATAFYDIAALAVGAWFKAVIALTSALIAIFANAIVSQATTSRLLFSMARDRQLPAFLAVVNATTKVPATAILLVAGLSTVIGVIAINRVELITSIVTFGSLTAYALLHVAVMRHFGRRKQKSSLFSHRISPVVGIAILLYALWSASSQAKVVAGIWLLVGGAVYLSRSRRLASK